MPIYAFTGSLTRPMPQYGAANGKGITRLAFDVATDRLSGVDVTGGLDDTAWVVTDARRGLLFATCEVPGTNQSAIAAYAVEAGGLRLVGHQPTLGNEACHACLSSDGRFLLVANYNGANPAGWPDQSVSVFPVDSSGTLGAAVASVRLEGAGPNKARQASAHAHCVVAAPDSDVVYVADLGIDKLVAYRLGADGSLAHEPDRDFDLPPGTGPRHLVFHPKGHSLFMVSELVPTVVSLRVDSVTGALTQQDVFLIRSLDSGIVQPAGIVLTANGTHLFVSLRVCDEILGLAIDPVTGGLSQTGRWKSGGKTPRDLALSPSERHLIVANQDSDRLTVFGVDKVSGTLSVPLQNIEVGSPMSVKLAAY